MAKDLPSNIVKATPGGKPFAVPKDPGTPDPRDPEWRVQVYIQNNYGRIVPVPKWRAYEKIQNHEGKLSTKEEYELFEKLYNETEGQRDLGQPTMISEEEWERIKSNEPIKPSPESLDEPVKEVPAKIEEPKPVQENSVLTAIEQTNLKIDQLTDAILQLVNKKEGQDATRKSNKSKQ